MCKSIALLCAKTKRVTGTVSKFSNRLEIVKSPRFLMVLLKIPDPVSNTLKRLTPNPFFRGSHQRCSIKRSVLKT